VTKSIHFEPEETSSEAEEAYFAAKAIHFEANCLQQRQNEFSL